MCLSDRRHPRRTVTLEELGAGVGAGAGLAGLLSQAGSPTHRPGFQEGGWGPGSCPGEGVLRWGQSQVKGACIWCGKAILASREADGRGRGEK